MLRQSAGSFCLMGRGKADMDVTSHLDMAYNYFIMNRKDGYEMVYMMEKHR